MLPWYSVLIFGLFFLYGDKGWQTALLTAALLHEVGHLMAAALCGVRVERVTLYPFGVDMVLATRPLRSYGTDLFIAVSGAGVNLLAACFTRLLGGEGVGAACHLGLAVLNLMPIRGLDGGTALELLCRRFLLPSHAEGVVRTVSFVTLLALWTVAVYLLFVSASDPSLFVLVCFLFATIFLPQGKKKG